MIQYLSGWYLKTLSQYPPRRYFNNILTRIYILWGDILTVLHSATISTRTIFQQYFTIIQQYPLWLYFNNISQWNKVHQDNISKSKRTGNTKSTSPLIWHLAKYRFRVGTDSAAHTCTHRYQWSSWGTKKNIYSMGSATLNGIFLV